MLQAHLAEMARDHALIMAILVNARTILGDEEIQEMRISRKRNGKRAAGPDISAVDHMVPKLSQIAEPAAQPSGEVPNQT